MPSSSLVKPSRRSLRILGVDDNRGDLELLRVRLRDVEDMQIEFLAVDRVERLEEVLDEAAFDLAFFDYSLTWTTGIELLQMAKAKGLDAPAILLTGQGDEKLVASALHAGFYDYIPKSEVSERSLGRAIRNTLEKHELRQEARNYRADLEATVKHLQERNREISSFYYTLAHELKTPLTAAREYASLVYDGLGGPVNPQQKEFLRTSMNACDQLRRCIEDLFDVSRIETGKFEVKRESQSLARIVELCVEQKRSTAKQADIDLSLERCGALPDLMLDELRINQVVSNLLTNAIKFSPQGSTVRVRCETADGGVAVVVADNGPGISPEDLEHIFERLYQGSGHATVTGGMGLGLHLCQELVRLHGGTISAVSEVGHGATFRVWLPCE